MMTTTKPTKYMIPFIVKSPVKIEIARARDKRSCPLIFDDANQ